MSDASQTAIDPHVLIAILAIVTAVGVLIFLFAWLNTERKAGD